MDFVTGIPHSQKKNDAISVVVDRLTKLAHFLPIRKDYSVSRLAEIFQQEIIRLHGTSAIITDGQTERTIWTLEDMLRSCALEWTGNWDEYLCLVEFAYNNSWRASIKAALFELLYGRKCRAPIYWNEVGLDIKVMLILCAEEASESLILLLVVIPASSSPMMLTSSMC
ncbi:retrotransposable element Tf2 [Tanacetum coccineum]